MNKTKFNKAFDAAFKKDQNRLRDSIYDRMNLHKGKGGTRKIVDALPRPCQCPEHNPPGMMVFGPGMYEHVCPTCGQKQVFAVDGFYL